MMAIRVRVMPATMNRGSSFIVECEAGRLVRPFHGDEFEVPQAVADLVAKIGWQDNGDWVGGDTKDGWVFTCRGKSPLIINVPTSTINAKVYL